MKIAIKSAERKPFAVKVTRELTPVQLAEQRVKNAMKAAQRANVRLERRIMELGELQCNVITNHILTV